LAEPRQRGLAVVNVTNGAHVHVRLGPLKFLFCHFSHPKKNKARVGFKVCTPLLNRPARAQGGVTSQTD